MATGLRAASVGDEDGDARLDGIVGILGLLFLAAVLALSILWLLPL